MSLKGCAGPRVPCKGALFQQVKVLPRQWPRQVKSAFLQTISVASNAFTCACGLAAKRKDKMKRLQAELAQTYREMALLKKEMQLKDERFRRLLPHRRPYYRPIQRMQIGFSSP